MDVCTGALTDEVKVLKLTISRFIIYCSYIPIHGLWPYFITTISLRYIINIVAKA